MNRIRKARVRVQHRSNSHQHVTLALSGRCFYTGKKHAWGFEKVGFTFFPL
jgi:hypothetical protein